MSATLLNTQVLTQPSRKRLSFSTPYSGPIMESNTWLVSFLVAVALHGSFFFVGKYLFVTPPEYGILGSVASMEVYMVAALPEPIVAREPQAIVQTILPEVSKAPNDMALAQVEKTVELRKEKSLKEALPKKVEEKKMTTKSEVKGEGSAKNPGESEATLFSRAGSETLGKTGKYQNLPPQYPSIAERNGWEGMVMLKAFIEHEGLASRVLIDRSSGFKTLDRAALKAVKKWKFEPGRMGGVVVSSWVKIPIRFRIEKTF